MLSKQLRFVGIFETAAELAKGMGVELQDLKDTFNDYNTAAEKVAAGWLGDNN